MVWQRRAKPPGEFLCRFDSCRLRQRMRIEDGRSRIARPKTQSAFNPRSSVFRARSSDGSERKLAELEVAGSSPAGPTRDRRSTIESRGSHLPSSIFNSQSSNVPA